MNLVYLDPETTENEARNEYERMVRFLNMPADELLELSKCFPATDDDLAYAQSRALDGKLAQPKFKTLAEWDLYQARLKVLAGLQPKTVSLIHKANTSEDQAKREKFHREAVQAFFAELAHKWTEDEVLDWQRNNPVGTAWLCEFGDVLREPAKEICPIKHELVLNWLRKNYNLLTADELSDAILVATGQRVGSGTLKKQRERLGLTTGRPPGPRPKAEQ